MLGDDGNIGVEEVALLSNQGFLLVFRYQVKKAFLCSPGVDPNLVPDGWVENHFRSEHLFLQSFV